MSRRSLALALVLTSIVACTASSGVELDEIAVDAEGDLGKADGTPELKVRAGETSIWLQPTLTVRPGAHPALVLNGRASRNIEDGRTFIRDDIYGDFLALSARKFESSWPISQARGLVDGVDVFGSISFLHSATRPDQLTTHIVVRPRARNFSGSSKLYLTAELTPVLVAGVLVYRLRGHASSDILGITADAGGVAIDGAAAVDARNFHVDLEPQRALTLIGAATPIAVRVDLGSGPAVKTAILGVAVHELGITEGDAYEVWPHECTDETLACLGTLAPGTLDLASCGDGGSVSLCIGSVGVRISVDDVTARVAELETRLADAAGLATDASALVGADRQTAFLDGLRTAITAQIQATQGRWLLDATARDTAMASVLDGAIDRAYAFALTGFSAREPVAGDVAATRQLVADALLDYLAAQDYVHSEFGRSYLELTRTFRAQHLASLRNFREVVEPQVDGADATRDIYVGDWIGAYTEIAVERSTGRVLNVYVELD